jgi:hypothetical protein
MGKAEKMSKKKNYLVVATVIGWLVFVFTIPATITGIFIVLGTAQPWGLVIPLLILTCSWVLTRLDFYEIYWKKTLGIIVTTWGIMGIFTTLLIISRADSLVLTYGVLPVLYCVGVGGLILTIQSPESPRSSPA